MLATCKSCGDCFAPSLRPSQIIGSMSAGELCYCLECANELFRDTISMKPARLFSSGVGCPLELVGSHVDDDNNPWASNAVRFMEGD